MPIKIYCNCILIFARKALNLKEKDKEKEKEENDRSILRPNMLFHYFEVI
jgi:hypothetical protein